MNHLGVIPKKNHSSFFKLIFVIRGNGKGLVENIGLVTKL